MSHIGKKSQNSKKKRGRKSGKAPSGLEGNRQDSTVWNILSGVPPRLNNTLKKDNSVHKFIQFIDHGIVVTFTAVTAFFTKNWTLSADVIQQSSYGALFDQYRIDEVEYWFFPDTGSVAGSANNGMVYTVVDYDDDATPGSFAALQQYTNVQITSTSSGHYIRFKPHIAVGAYNGSFVGFANQPANWLDMASGTVRHYGFKAGVSTSVSIPYRAMSRIHFSCRNLF